MVYPTGPNTVTRVIGGSRRVTFRDDNVRMGAEVGVA